jgi:hypothetical protein
MNKPWEMGISQPENRIKSSAAARAIVDTLHGAPSDNLPFGQFVEIHVGCIPDINSE